MSCWSWTHDKVQIKQALESKKKEHKDANKNQEYMTLHTIVILSGSYPSKIVVPLLSMYSLFTCISSILLLIQKWWLLEETKDWRLLLKSKTYNWI